MATPFPGILETTLFLKGDASSTPHLTRLKVEIRIAPVQHNQLLEKSAGTVELRSGVGWNLIFFFLRSLALLPFGYAGTSGPVELGCLMWMAVERDDLRHFFGAKRCQEDGRKNKDLGLSWCGVCWQSLVVGWAIRSIKEDTLQTSMDKSLM